jgi:hypothetical protein
LNLCLPGITLSRSESSLSISASDMGEGAAATVRKAKWGRTQVALKLFRGDPEQIYKELTAEAAILHVSQVMICAPPCRAVTLCCMPAAHLLCSASTPSSAASPLLVPGNDS